MQLVHFEGLFLNRRIDCLFDERQKGIMVVLVVIERNPRVKLG